ncbi:MAG: protein kinase [Candidatus Omnitrophica bacterium]|nr:protein kinase [Candidatus Omnitrophota bacterium]
MFRKIISLTIILTLIVNPASFAGFSPPPSVRAVTAGESLDSFVTVSDFFIPGTGKTSFETALLDPRQPLLLYLEDAHGNLSAQRHITQALDWISKQAKLREPWIALEGTGPGEIDHRVLSAFPHRPARMDVAEKFLRQGRLNGAEYFAALNPNVRLFGVDSEVLAERNRRKYRGLARLQPETGGPLLRLIRASQFLKKKIYYGDLVRLDQSAVQFEQDSRNLLKHLALLRNLAKRKGVSLDKYPHLSSALRGPAPSLSGSLNAAETLLEIRRLTEDLWKKLLDYREARDAFFMDRQVKFYQKLLSCSLLPEDYSKYVKDPRGYSLDSLKRRTQLYHFLLRPESLRPRKGDFEALEIASQPALEFYELARKRDQFLIANLEALVPKGPSRKTFFISGGFHRQGVSSLLRSKEIPFAVLTPKITQSGGEENYRRLLAQTSAVNLKSSFRIPEFRNKFRRALLTSLRADPFLPDGTKIRILERYRKSFPPELISISRSEVRNPEISPLVLTNDKSRDAAVNLIQFGEALIDRVGQSAGSGEAPVPLNGALLKGFFKSAFHYMTNDPKNPERILNLAETFMGAWEGWEWEVRFGKYERPYRVTRPFDPGEGKPVWREKSLLIEIDRETLRRFQSNQLAEFYLATTFFGRLLFGALSSDRNKIDLRRAEAEVAAALLRSFKNSEEEKRSFAGNFLQALMQTQQTALATEIRSRLTRQSRGKVKLQNGRIELGEQLGKGGFGTAYEAVLGRLKVVVKKAEGASLATSEGKARYDREAQIIAAFAQRGFTNLVGWREDFKENGEQYTVMDFAEGKPLSDLLPLLTEKEAIEVLIETARALEQMNSIGVFHRDVKPDNIIVHWDSRTRKVLQVKLIDYGLAKIFNWELARQAGIQPSRFVDEETGEERSQTQSGTGMGTPGYMSPEQAQGEQSKLGPQTDYYALGAMAYEMKAGYKAGDPPSKRATSAFDLITRQINGQYEDPSRLAGMPPELARLIKKAMAPELSERFQTAKELREALEHYLRISSEASPPPSQIQKPKELSGSTPQTPQTPKVSRLKRDRFQKRGPPTVKLLIGAVAALVLGVIGVIFLHSGEKSPPIPTTPTTVAPTIPKQAAPPSTVATTVPPEIPAVSPKPPKPEVKTPEKKTSSQGPDPETLSQAQRALEALKEASQKLPPDLQAFEGELTGLLTALDQSGKDLLAARKALLSSFQNLTEGLQVLERHLSKPEDRRGDPSKALIDRLKQAGPRILNEMLISPRKKQNFKSSPKPQRPWRTSSNSKRSPSPNSMPPALNTNSTSIFKPPSSPSNGLKSFGSPTAPISNGMRKRGTKPPRPLPRKFQKKSKNSSFP